MFPSPYIRNENLTFQQARVCEGYTRDGFRFIYLVLMALRTPVVGYSSLFLWPTFGYILQYAFYNTISMKFRATFHVCMVGAPDGKLKKQKLKNGQINRKIDMRRLTCDFLYSVYWDSEVPILLTCWLTQISPGGC